MTAPPGYRFVSERSVLVMKIILTAIVVGAGVLGGLFLLVSDTRTRQGQDRVVIQRISKSPCANLSKRECQRLLITPEYLVIVLRKAGLLASEAKPGPRSRGRVALCGRRGCLRSPQTPGAERPGGGRGSNTGGRGGNSGGRGGTRNSPPSGTTVAPAQAQPQPEPSPGLAPQLPSVPSICLDAGIAGVCVGG